MGGGCQLCRLRRRWQHQPGHVVAWDGVQQEASSGGGTLGLELAGLRTAAALYADLIGHGMDPICGAGAVELAEGFSGQSESATM